MHIIMLMTMSVT